MAFSIAFVFVLGYIFIACEHVVKINKAAIALVTGIICWTIYIFPDHGSPKIILELMEHIGEIAGILFFLMGAMTIVEIVDAHNGFSIISSLITTNSKKILLFLISIITFFLSALLDNLTTTIVMVSLLSKLIDNREEKLLFTGMVVIAANAGGAWSPIGDVTTTMMWIGGQISTVKIIGALFIPSLVSLLVPLLFLCWKIRGKTDRSVDAVKDKKNGFEETIVFFAGIGALFFVPIFKATTGLPPFMGILLGLGAMWILTELIHHDKEPEHKNSLSIVGALQRIDMASVLFFLGILVSVAALASIGLLERLAYLLDTKVGNENIIVILIGIISAIIDNVPLVAASMGMYELSRYPMDHQFWHLLAYCAGTGGSALIIGSAAGVAAMGIMKINFFWYLKCISPLALLGYFAGVAAYFIQIAIMQ